VGGGGARCGGTGGAGLECILGSHRRGTDGAGQFFAGEPGFPEGELLRPHLLRQAWQESVQTTFVQGQGGCPSTLRCITGRAKLYLAMPAHQVICSSLSCERFSRSLWWGLAPMTTMATLSPWGSRFFGDPVFRRRGTYLGREPDEAKVSRTIWEWRLGSRGLSRP